MRKNAEPKRAASIYEKDIELLNAERKEGKFKGWSMADMIRLCVEYSRAHGVFAV